MHQTLDLLLDGEYGIWHLANVGEVSWYELARRSAEIAEISSSGLCPISLEEAGWRAPRPRYSALASERGWMMPTLDSALARYVNHCECLLERIAA